MAKRQEDKGALADTFSDDKEWSKFDKNVLQKSMQIS